jgi:hypothetical protein
MSHWWWPFGKDRREASRETENEFQSQLAEALLRKDDLKEAAASMKRDRLEREQRAKPDTRHKLKLG